MYECRAKARVILYECTGWSESAHFAHVWRYVFAWRGQFEIRVVRILVIWMYESMRKVLRWSRNMKSVYFMLTSTCNVYLHVSPLHHEKHAYIILTPIKSTLYSKTGVCRGMTYVSYFAKNIGCGYTLEPPRRGGSNEYPQSMFWAEIWKNNRIFIRTFSFFFFFFLVVKVSI